MSRIACTASGPPCSVSVAPCPRASSSRSSERSTQTIRSAPWSRQPATAPSPTIPAPKTTQVEPGCTRAVFIAAPRPVERPQAKRQVRSSGASGGFFASAISGMTGYSGKVEVPMKCRIGPGSRVEVGVAHAGGDEPDQDLPGVRLLELDLLHCEGRAELLQNGGPDSHPADRNSLRSARKPGRVRRRARACPPYSFERKVG